MKALSIQQPWAWCILHAGKDIENRDWSTGLRGRIYLHTGKNFDRIEWSWIKDNFGVEIPRDLPTGGIVGSVEIVDCVRTSNSRWFFGDYGFVLRNSVELPFIPYRGQLGFFEVPDNVLNTAHQ
jgi:hypothetical protein